MNRSGLCRPDEYKLEELFQVEAALQEIILLEDDYALVHGVVCIVDVSQLSIGHMAQMTPSLMKRISVFSEDAVPLRMRATHFINATNAFERFFNTMKPLMSKKQQQRVKQFTYNESRLISLNCLFIFLMNNLFIVIRPWSEYRKFSQGNTFGIPTQGIRWTEWLHYGHR